MKINTNISKVIYMNELADLVITAIITFIDFRALSNLATLSTRNVLNTLTVLNAERSPPPPLTAVKSNSKIERLTTPPSSQFILSCIYFLGPIAATFEVNSPIKIHVKTEPINSNYSARSESILYFSMPMITVFSSTQRVNALSNKLCFTIILSNTLAFFRTRVGPLGHTLTELI